MHKKESRTYDRILKCQLECIGLKSNYDIEFDVNFYCVFKEREFEDAKPVIAALKSLGMCAIGAAGFYWGGEISASSFFA